MMTSFDFDVIGDTPPRPLPAKSVPNVQKPAPPPPPEQPRENKAEEDGAKAA